MLKVGLTGNLCSGYEEVAIQFQKLGVPVFDADVVLKFMIHYDEMVSKDIRVTFGEKSFENGFLNERIFNSTQKLELLLNTVHKKLMKSWENFRLKHKTEPYVIFKYALLFERNIDSSMNFTINTFRPKNDRIEVYLKKNLVPFIEAYSIIENGPDDIQKNKLATYIIHNYSDASVGIEAQVKSLDHKLRGRVSTHVDSLETNSILRNVML